MCICTFRTACPGDEKLLLSFIHSIAAYENLEDQVVATEELLRDWLFEKAAAEAFFVVENGVEVGFALYFLNFSTFMGRGGMYLEDLFILPQHRGKGYGKAAFKRIAEIAVARGCGRMDWACLDWNQPSINFYLSMGAVPMADWTIYRLEGDTLINAAKE